MQKRGISSLGTPKVVPTLSDDEDAPPPMPADEDDEDGLNEFLPSDVDPGAQSDASNNSAPEKVEVKPTKPVVKKPTKKPKGKKMTRAKWQAAKQKALESKEEGAEGRRESSGEIAKEAERPRVRAKAAPVLIRHGRGRSARRGWAATLGVM